MSINKIKQCGEGIVITTMGLVFFYLAITIRSNPQKMAYAWLDFFVQARFMPTLVSIAIIGLGIAMIRRQLQGKMETAKQTKTEILNMLAVLALCIGYVLLIVNIGFIISTAVFLAVILFYLNYGQYKVWLLLLLVAAFTVVGVYITPMALNLYLP